MTPWRRSGSVVVTIESSRECSSATGTSWAVQCGNVAPHEQIDNHSILAPLLRMALGELSSTWRASGRTTVGLMIVLGFALGLTVERKWFLVVNVASAWEWLFWIHIGAISFAQNIRWSLSILRSGSLTNLLSLWTGPLCVVVQRLIYPSVCHKRIIQSENIFNISQRKIHTFCRNLRYDFPWTSNSLRGCVLGRQLLLEVVKLQDSCCSNWMCRGCYM